MNVYEILNLIISISLIDFDMYPLYVWLWVQRLSEFNLLPFKVSQLTTF
jgi:hypothetical protein